MLYIKNDLINEFMDVLTGELKVGNEFTEPENKVVTFLKQRLQPPKHKLNPTSLNEKENSDDDSGKSSEEEETVD